MMENVQDFLKKVEKYRIAKGWSEATIGNKAAGSARFVAILRRKSESVEADIRRLEKMMSEHPVDGVPK